jgi:hypothetical protein
VQHSPTSLSRKVGTRRHLISDYANRELIWVGGAYAAVVLFLADRIVWTNRKSNVTLLDGRKKRLRRIHGPSARRFPNASASSNTFVIPSSLTSRMLLAQGFVRT